MKIQQQFQKSQLRYLKCAENVMHAFYDIIPWEYQPLSTTFSIPVFYTLQVFQVSWYSFIWIHEVKLQAAPESASSP